MTFLVNMAVGLQLKLILKALASLNQMWHSNTQIHFLSLRCSVEYYSSFKVIINLLHLNHRHQKFNTND